LEGVELHLLLNLLAEVLSLLFVGFALGFDGPLVS
jgi:hypothetical protein